jgi:protocatechuate 3,4-dioxygenase beta subunit
MQPLERLTRRSLLYRAAGLAVAGSAAASWQVEEAGAGPRAVASGAVTCILSPEMTEGPYYLHGEAVRRNITEGKPGTPLTLHLSVVNASSCKPIKAAAVDIWHADATGVYSGVQGQTGTYLRGIQRTDASGLAVFDTIYPGWYRGRAVHIHVKVHLGGNVVHTGQLFFPDALSDEVYKVAPYSSRGNPDTPDASDSIYRNGGSKSLLSLKKSGSGYMGSIVMGVHTG